MPPPTHIDPKARAQLLMSQALDGEISPQDADWLNAYLEAHPNEMDWMESQDIARGELASESTSSSPEVAEFFWKSVSESSDSSQPGTKLVHFPKSLLKYGSIAAGVAVLATAGWFGSRSGSETNGTDFVSTAAVVEYVETEIPDASTFVYTDEESGWTVVWVESMEPLPNDHS